MRCTPFRPQILDNHPGRLHAAMRVVDNAWRDDGGLAMLIELVALFLQFLLLFPHGYQPPAKKKRVQPLFMQIWKK